MTDSHLPLQASYGAGRAAVRPGETPLSETQLLAVCGMLFFLAGTNAEPLWWSSAIPSVVLGSFLLFTRNPRAIAATAMGPGNRAITVSIFALSFFTIVSAAVSPNPTTIEATVERALIPLLIYMSLVGLVLTTRQIYWILTALVAGIILSLFRGTVAFYQEWGVPDLLTVLWAKYNTFRMTSYMSATFGNVGHMGEYLALVVPMLIYLIARYPIGNARRLVLTGVLALAMVHLLISGSRAAILILLLSLAIILVRMGIRGGILFALGLLLIGVTASYQSASYLGEQDILTRFLPSQIGTGIDESVVERYMSIQEGWSQFLAEPLFGIGPGMSPEFNSYSIPHQSLVFVLSEIGIFGGAAFVVLNLSVFIKLTVATLSSSVSGREHWQLLWLIGPACWMLYGLIAGFTFNMSLALVWIGTAYAMLALATGTVVATDERQGLRL